MSSLFHSLVVCGAGLTLVSCGGRSEWDQKESEPAQGGGSNQGGSGSVGSGLVGSGGALMLTPSGGTNSAGSSALGGTTGVTMPGPLLPGAEGQWVCDTELSACAGGFLEDMQVVGFNIGSACAADPTRPKSSDDCAGQGKFSCSIGFFGEQAVLFNCECTPPELDNQGCPCPETGGGCYSSRGPEYCNELQAYCGCAMTCIAK